MATATPETLAAGQTEQLTEIRCPMCGRSNSAGAEVCQSCGARVGKNYLAQLFGLKSGRPVVEESAILASAPEPTPMMATPAEAAIVRDESVPVAGELSMAELPVPAPVLEPAIKIEPEQQFPITASIVEVEEEPALPPEQRSAWQEAALKMEKDQFAETVYVKTNSAIAATAVHEFHDAIAAGRLDRDQYLQFVRQITVLVDPFRRELDISPEQLSWPEAAKAIADDKFSETVYQRTNSQIAAVVAHEFNPAIADRRMDKDRFLDLVQKIASLTEKLREENKL